MSHRGPSSSANELASPPHRCSLTCQPILSRHYASMTQDGVWIAGGAVFASSAKKLCLNCISPDSLRCGGPRWT